MRRRTARSGKWLGLLVLAAGAIGVITASPALAATINTVNPNPVPSGSTAQVTGTGTSGELITFYLDDPTTGTVVGSTTADGSGNYTGSITLTGSGTRNLYARGNSSGAGNAFQVTIGTGGTGNRTISASPTNPGIGQPVTITGSGFFSSTTVTVSGSGFNTSSANVSSGSFSTVLTSNSSQTGTVTITATGQNGESGVTTVNIGGTGNTGNCTVSVSPFNPSVTQPISVSGSGAGFSPGEQVTVLGDGYSTVVVSADASGNFSTTLTPLASQTLGQKSIRAQNASNTRYCATSVNVGGITGNVGTISLTPATAAPGQTITISGSGFAVNSPITVLADNVTIATGPSTASGTFSIPYAIQTNTQPGVRTITARDNTGRTSNGVSLTVSGTGTGTATSAFISVNPTAVSPGQSVTISGSGFTPNDTVTLTLGGATITATANAGGSFSYPHTVPTNTPAGAYTITARDSAGHTGTASLTISNNAPAIPTPAVSTSAGGRGTALTGANSMRIGVFAVAILLYGMTLRSVRTSAVALVGRPVRWLHRRKRFQFPSR